MAPQKTPSRKPRAKPKAAKSRPKAKPKTVRAKPRGNGKSAAATRPAAPAPIVAAAVRSYEPAAHSGPGTVHPHHARRVNLRSALAELEHGLDEELPSESAESAEIATRA